MAIAKKIGKVSRKPGTLVYVTKTGDVMETKPNRKGGKKGRKVCTRKAAPKKVATKKKAAPKKAVAKKKVAAKKPAAKRTVAKKKAAPKQGRLFR